MDGELWADAAHSANFGIARSERASDEDWRNVSYRAFDLPVERGTFDERLAF
jgi:hypothetical protein